MKINLRSLLWRIGRYIYKYARKENFYSPKNNGEYALVKNLIRGLGNKNRAVFLDIGAFKGDWSLTVSEYLKVEKKQGKIFTFEPATNTFNFLKKKITNNNNIILSNKAFSDISGRKNFFIFGELNGTNSLIKNKTASINKVNTVTVDEFIEINNLKNIYLIKSDTEGHDFSVIKGAKKAFKKKIIHFWQFEYNHRWIDNRSYLKDVFLFFKDSNYLIGKVTKDQIEVYTIWNEELERYFEANYLIINKDNLNKIKYKMVVFNKYSVIENE